MSPHSVLALLLVLGSLSAQQLHVVEYFVSGTHLVGIVRPEFEMMRFEFFQFFVVQGCFVGVLPCFEQCAVGSIEGALLWQIETVAPEWIVAVGLSVNCFFASVVLGVDGVVVLRSAA